MFTLRWGTFWAPLSGASWTMTVFVSVQGWTLITCWSVVLATQVLSWFRVGQRRKYLRESFLILGHFILPRGFTPEVTLWQKGQVRHSHYCFISLCLFASFRGNPEKTSAIINIMFPFLICFNVSCEITISCRSSYALKCSIYFQATKHRPIVFGFPTSEMTMSSTWTKVNLLNTNMTFHRFHNRNVPLLLNGKQHFIGENQQKWNYSSAQWNAANLWTPVWSWM